jgi:ornithine cyclodeaminase/alanine dehydrogenase-like protein (mu-crystallin family)
VVSSKLVVDQREAALAEAGDVMIPIDEGHMTADQIHAELGEVVAGLKAARTGKAELTVFKSVGLAIQDVATATRVYRLAKEKGAGTTLSLS